MSVSYLLSHICVFEPVEVLGFARWLLLVLFTLYGDATVGCVVCYRLLSLGRGLRLSRSKAFLMSMGRLAADLISFP